MKRPEQIPYYSIAEIQIPLSKTTITVICDARLEVGRVSHRPAVRHPVWYTGERRGLGHRRCRPPGVYVPPRRDRCGRPCETAYTTTNARCAAKLTARPNRTNTSATD